MDLVLRTLKEWLATANPGLVRCEDLVAVEAQLDELAELVDEIEAKVARRSGAASAPPAAV